MSPMAFYVQLDCPQCGAEFHTGLCQTFLEHNGLPVVMADMIAESRMDCPECGAAIYYGELPRIVEPWSAT